MKQLAVLFLVLSLTESAAAESLRVLALETDVFFYRKDGRPAGIEYDILAYFAKARELDLEIEWVGSFPELLERIEKGEGDLAAGTITITPMREERMSFSAPYFPVQIVLVQREGETTSSLDDLVGAKVGAFESTTAEDALREVPGIGIVHGESLESMLNGVMNGDLRAALADSSSVIPALDSYPSLEIGMTLGEEQHFGFAMPKGSLIQKALSEHILRLKDSGIYFRFVTEHLGPRASEIVRAAKAP